MEITETLSAQHTDKSSPPPPPVETEKEDSWLKRTVRLSGISFLIGDGAIIGGGLVRALGKNGNRHELGNALTGLIWAQAGVASSLFGNPKKPMQLRIHAHNLEQSLARQGIVIPDDVRQQNDLLVDKGYGERAQRFISKYPTEVFNSIIGGASVGMVYSGAKAMAAKQKAGTNSLWAGLLVMAGAISGLIIKEDPDAREKAKDSNVLARGVAYVREKPLRLTSVFYLLNDWFLGKRAFTEFKDFKSSGGADKRFIYPAIATVANILGNLLLFVSHRNQLKEGYSPEQVAQFEDLAAQMIAHRPEESRNTIVETVANYMRNESISERPIEQLRKEIVERAAILEGQAPMSHQQRLQAQPEAETSRSMT